MFVRVKIFIHFLFSSASNFNVLSSRTQRVFVFLAADYGNLGDVAITYAQEKFLKEKFPDAEVMEIPISKNLSGIKAVKKVIKQEDIITIVGGGNMGDMYDDIEFLRELVVLSFKKNRIISFPQTIDFSNTLSGKIKLKFAKFVYIHHKKLTLLAREQVSYQRMLGYFPNVDVKLTPDIVMTLDCRQVDVNRKGIIFCLRDDLEKGKVDANALRNKLEDDGVAISDYDTHIGRNHLSQKERYDELHKIWTAFSHSELIITDRLHGMIFAFITGTPAIVLPNSNFKIQACFEWIKDCGYVKFFDNLISVDLDKRILDNFDRIHTTLIRQFDKIFYE